MQQLSTLDAAFLYLESDDSPMHIGCVLTFEAPKNGQMSFPRFKRFIETRLPCSAVFRRRLERLPLDLDRPYWIEDRDFNIDNHLTYAEISGKHYANQQTALIDEFFSDRLNPVLPLWEMLYISNKNPSDDEFTVLLKIHHAAIDGVSGEKILAALMSIDPNQAPAIVDKWTPEYPSLIRMASNKIRSLATAPKELTTLTKRFSKTLEISHKLRTRDGQQQPPYFFNSPATPFNRELESVRHINNAHLSLSAIKAVKNAYPNCTVNDVVLAICGGALRKYLISIGELPKNPIVAMVPVSKRKGNEEHQGNLVSAMLVSLATDIASPVERLEAIQSNTLTAKGYNREIAMEEMLSHLPAWTSSWFMKAYTRLNVARVLKPIFNLVITNVPGSPYPLYLDGAKLKTMSGMAPIVDGMGLSVVVTSYMNSLTISLTSNQTMAAHMPAIINNMHASLEELRKALTPSANKVVLNAVST